MGLLQQTTIYDRYHTVTGVVDVSFARGWGQNEVPLFVPLYKLVTDYLDGICGETGTTLTHPCNSHGVLPNPIGLASYTGLPDDFTYHSRPLSGFVDITLDPNPVPGASTLELDGLVNTLFADAGAHIHTSDRRLQMHYSVASYVFDEDRGGGDEDKYRRPGAAAPIFAVSKQFSGASSPTFTNQIEDDLTTSFQASINACTTSAHDQTRWLVNSSPDSVLTGSNDDRVYRLMHICAWPTRRLVGTEDIGPIADGREAGVPIGQTQSYFNPDFYHAVISEHYSDDGSAVENGIGFFGMSTADLRPTSTPLYTGRTNERNIRRETLLHPSCRQFGYDRRPEVYVTAGEDDNLYRMEYYNSCEHRSTPSTEIEPIEFGDVSAFIPTTNYLVLPTIIGGGACDTFSLHNPNRPYVELTAATATEDIGKVCKYTHFAFTRVF